MKEPTDRQIEDFFNHLKTLPEYYSIDNIKELIDSPDALPNHQVSNYASTFKSYFIKTSIAAIILSTILFFVTHKEEKAIDAITENQQIEHPLLSTKTDQETNNEEKERRKDISPVNEEIKENVQATMADHQEKETLVNEEVNKEVHVDEFQPEIANSENENTEQLPTSMSKHQCSWPSDTVLNGQNMVLELSKDELEKMGFMIDNTGFYYKNEYEGKRSTFHTRMENGSGEMTAWSTTPNRHNKKTEYSAHDFYPMYMTDYFFRVNGSNNPIAHYDKIKDILVPVKVSQSLLKLSQWDMSHILWVRATPSLFDVLPKRYVSLRETYSCIEEIRKSTGRQDVVQYQFEPLIRVTQYVSLDQLTLEKIGFIFSKDRIVYTQRRNNCKTEIILKYKSHGTHNTMGPKKDRTNDYNLIFLSDSIGYQSVKWDCDSSPNKFTMGYFKNRNETLIPIEIKKESYPDILNKNLIFWFEPTEAMLDIIPGKQGSQIRKEYKYLVSEDKTGLESSCTFFEACRATLHLHNFTLSPNPTSGVFTMKFEAGEPMEMTVHLTSLNGQILNRLASFRDIKIGSNSFDFNIGDAPSGIYLLTIQTKKGFLSKRVIVEK